MPKLFKEFKEFAVKGNVLDMAIGVIIGGAFGKIVTSFVNDVIMPPIGIILGGVDFTSFTLTLKKATEDAEAVTLNYGLFLNTVIDFIIVALVIFSVIKMINRLKRKEEKAEDAEKEKEKKVDAEIVKEGKKKNQAKRFYY